MVTLVLDHLAVSASTRDEGRAYIEEALGVPMQTGGAHARFGTHNHLMGLGDGLYLEAISIDPAAPEPDRARWFDLDSFAGKPRLTNWICAVGDLDAALRQWPGAGDAIALERGDLRWHMAVPRSGKLPFDGLFPPLIKWQGDLHPSAMLDIQPVRLSALTILHPEADALGQSLGAIDNAVVRFETNKTASLFAEFDTPHGRKVLA